MLAHDIITIAGSAGALQALQSLVHHLPPRLPAALFVVLHTSADSPGVLPDILARGGPFPAAYARSGDPIHHGHIYIAPPDHHLLLERTHLRLGRGPKENGFRPAADPLFRSAACAFGLRVVGIVLSGSLDDGTAGLQAIKHHGGLAIVQDPDEALYSSMPASAARSVDVDHIAPLAAMPALITRLATQPLVNGAPAVKRRKPAPDSAAQADLAISSEDLPGAPSAFICPACGGALWEVQNGQVKRYRCHVGHAYTPEALAANQDGALENALWVALRTLEDAAALRRRLAADARERHMAPIADGYERRAHDAEDRAALIRDVLLSDRLPPAQRGRGTSKPARLLNRRSPAAKSKHKPR